MDRYGVDTSMLRGPVVKVVLLSGPLGGPRVRVSGEEEEQRLTLSEKGGAWLTRYYAMKDGYEWQERSMRERLHADRETVRTLIEAVVESLLHLDCGMACDAGNWELILEDDQDNKCRAYGSVIPDCMAERSEFIREKLGRWDLFLFNGPDYDQVDRLEFDLEQKKEIRHQRKTPDEKRYESRDYHEKMIIDRTSETVEYEQQFSPDCNVKTRYHLGKAVSSFLDGLSPSIFSLVEGNPKDVCENPLRSGVYQIVLTMQKSRKREIRGTYDKKGLPVDWPSFAEKLFRFLDFYELKEIFNQRAYGKVRRRKGELIFCAVSFEEGGQRYWYMADSDDYEEGDFVQIPAGEDNHLSFGRVELVKYCWPEQAPYPLDKVKRIIRKEE